MSRFIDRAAGFIAPVCRWMRRICVRLSHGETKEEETETEISRWAIGEDVETDTVGTEELVGCSRCWAARISPTEKSTLGEITCWPWSFLLGCILTCVDIEALATTAEPLLSLPIVFDFISQSPSSLHRGKLVSALDVHPLTWYSAFSASLFLWSIRRHSLSHIKATKCNFFPVAV